jgi:hypothetical protein
VSCEFSVAGVDFETDEARSFRSFRV